MNAELLQRTGRRLILQSVYGSDSLHRGEATIAIEKLDASNALEVISSFLRDGNWWTRHEAVGAFRELPKEQSVEFIRPLLSDDHALVRLEAIRAIRDIYADSWPRGALRFIAPLLRDELAQVRYEAACAFGEVFGDFFWPPWTDELMAPLLKDEWSLVRSEALRNLGAYWDNFRPGDVSEALQLVTPLLHDEHSLVRKQAARVVGVLRPSNAVQLIAPLLEDPDCSVRQAVITHVYLLSATKLLAAPDAVKVIAPLLQDEVSSVRSTAACVLTFLGAPFEVFAPSLDDSDLATAAVAAGAAYTSNRRGNIPTITPTNCSRIAAALEEGHTLCPSLAYNPIFTDFLRTFMPTFLPERHQADVICFLLDALISRYRSDYAAYAAKRLWKMPLLQDSLPISDAKVRQYLHHYKSGSPPPAVERALRAHSAWYRRLFNRFNKEPYFVSSLEEFPDFPAAVEQYANSCHVDLAKLRLNPYKEVKSVRTECKKSGRRDYVHPFINGQDPGLFTQRLRDTDSDPLNQLIRAELLEEIFAILNADFSTEEFKWIKAVLSGECTSSTAARALDKPAGTIRSTISRLCGRIRRKLGNDPL